MEAWAAIFRHLRDTVGNGELEKEEGMGTLGTLRTAPLRDGHEDTKGTRRFQSPCNDPKAALSGRCE